MKIILSRKGFDSTSGGKPSPIMPDGTLLSLPIPDDSLSSLSKTEGIVRFDDLRHGKHLYSDLIKGILPNNSYSTCHLDPDIREDVRINPIKGWKPAFGQTGSSLGILRNANVSVGDIFLFFGLYQKVEYYNGSIRFIKGTRPMQVVYGYLQVGKILESPEEISKYYWHPHAIKGLYNSERNALFLPSDSLSLCTSLPGYGVLQFREDRVLTKKNENPATWNEHDFLLPKNIYDKRKNSAIGAGVYYAGRWQELVLKQSDKANEWALSMITEHKDTIKNATQDKVSSWHIGIAAEAAAAALFARHGFNISVQYGANQPDYDLLVEKDNDILKISVKGSQTGSWGLIQSYKKERTYHEAADEWVKSQGKKTVFCLVQYKDVDAMSMPRIYLALPYEIAEALKQERKGNGDSILYENHTWQSGLGVGTTDKLPECWKFSTERIEKLLSELKG